MRAEVPLRGSGREDGGSTKVGSVFTDERHAFNEFPLSLEKD